MKQPFMGEDFLLHNETARRLYHDYAAKMPIIDYHCHIDPKEIYEDKVFPDMAAVWLGGDHYKWRVMRANGVPERYITGDATPYEKFERWAAVLPKLIGNPLYHWTHLELQRYFGIDEPLNPATCRAIWDKANSLLPGLSARAIIEKSGVTAICTTDDPADDLRWHKLLRDDKSLSCTVLPAFRPDKAMNIDKPGFLAYIKKLGQASGMDITDIDRLKAALRQRLDAFCALGCRASDHGLDYIMFDRSADAGQVFKAALKGEAPTQAQADAFKTELMSYLGGLYRERGIVMQLHYGAVRNNNPLMFERLGPDTGFDAIGGGADSGTRLGALLGHIGAEHGLPKTIIYSLNPCDDAQIGAMIGCFQSDEHPGQMQHGSAWWFNDTKHGMEAQLTNLASLSVLGNFVGMLTDSRSFLSYTRHEYFRRILCNLLGTWVENGEYPDDLETLGRMVQDISYNNTLAYFNLAAR